MFQYLWLPCMVTVAAIALSAILFKEFLKKRAGQIAVEGSADNKSATKNGTVERAARTCTSPRGKETATSSGYEYEVFLSFRGRDTRAGFTNFLYTSMIDVGIRVCKDDKELLKGEKFGPKLLQAIYQSKILIPIFSKGYASSAWCLKELVQMVECQKKRGQKIMPIFYDVAPSEVRYQTGGYGEAFITHENKKRCDEDTMRQWKAALTTVGELDGWDLQSMPNREEGEIAKAVTRKVFSELKKAYLVVSDYLVNVDHHVDEIMKMIGAKTSETRIIGIHGMGGVGKTTIAKIIYNKLSNNFKCCCFLSNIREMSVRKGIECLQQQLISDILNTKWIDIRNSDEGIKIIKDRLSHEKVLLLLDDVDEKNHMDALVGKRDWFGKGSKLIITTRNKEVLKLTKVDDLYELNGMDPDQSLELFSKHAFRRNSPLDEYIDQSNRAIGISGGLPLALEVIGSLLSCTEKQKWDDTLEKLKNVPHAEVQSKLKLSYDALEVRQQHIFLDIACLFIGHDKDIVVHFWEKSKFFPEEAMEVLLNMSLIKIEKYNKVWMHDQLRDLGREIVRQESKMKIEKQSRVWNPEEALNLLRHKGKKEVEALRLKLDHEWQYRFTYKDFKRLSNLRFLEVDDSKEKFHAEETLFWHESPSNVLPTNVFHENSYLLPQLRWLSWHNIPPIFNITNFSMGDVVILNLSGSAIAHDWNGWSHMEEIKNLKVLNLTNCLCLERTPNISGHANLERLILQGCCKLAEIDMSICQLKCLVSLDLRDCESLRRLPDELGRLKALKELRIDKTPIKEIPDCHEIKNLRTFTASDCRRITLPLSIGDLASLEYLSLRQCKSLTKLPDSIGNLGSLIDLDISLTSIKELPDSIGNLKNLKTVKMIGISIGKIPDSLWTIEKLEEIEAYKKNGTEGFHVKIGNCIYRNQSLRIMRLRNAKICTIPRLSKSLIVLELDTLYMTTFPDLSNLTNLKELCMSFGPSHYEVGPMDGLLEDPMPWWIGKLSKLESLHLVSDFMTTLSTDISLLPQLKTLELSCCNLRCLPRLPSSLLSLHVTQCKSLCSMDILNLKKSLLIGSSTISEIRGPNCLDNLQYLFLVELGQVEILPDLSNFNKLSHLHVSNCDNLVEIQGELPRSLNILEIWFCETLQKLPDLSSLKSLQQVDINDCKKLNVEALLGFTQINQVNLWENLQNLHLSDLRQAEILPNLGNFNKLRSLTVRNCANLIEIQGKPPQSLEELEICSCESLQKLPDLSSLKKLQKVVIHDCMRLNVEPSLGFARRSQANLWENLKHLQISSLGKVEILPDLSNLNELRSLTVRNCGNLIEIQGELPHYLEELEIDSCESLQKLPNLSSLKGMQEVIIEDCMKLNLETSLGFPWRRHANLWEDLQRLRICGLGQVEILPDISNLNKLRSLTVRNCGNLVEIQGQLPQSLEELEISFCESLQKLPNLLSLKELQEVVIEDCIKLNVEASLGFAQTTHVNLGENLQHLQLSGLRKVEILLDLSNLNKLRSLKVQNCANLVEIQGELPQSLEEFEISSCESLQKLPNLLSLKRLQEIIINNCMKLNGEASLGFTRRSHTNLGENLQHLRLSSLGKVEILPNLSTLNKLRSFQVLNCDNLVEIQGELPQFLKDLEIDSCESLQKLPNLSSLNEVQKVVINDCMKLNVEAILGFTHSHANLWENLEHLQLSKLGQMEILHDLSNLNKLSSLQVRNCGNLVEIQGELPQSLEELEIKSCESLQKLPDLLNLKGLQKVVIEDCMELNVVASLGFTWRSHASLGENLQYLRLSSLGKVEILPDLSILNKLKSLQVQNCDNLLEIQGELPQSLKELKMDSCISLQKLPYLSSLKGLQEVVISDCTKLNVEASLGFTRRSHTNFWENLQRLELSKLGQVEILPDLSDLNKLRYLQVQSCDNLVEIQGGLPYSLVKLEISSCKSLRKLPDLSSLKAQQEVFTNDCMKLNVEASLGFARRSYENLWENLQYLSLSGLGKVEILPDLSNLNKLRSLTVQNCANLIEIQGELPQSLEKMEINSCESLQKLPDLSSLKGLKEVVINDYKKSNVETSLGFDRRLQADLWEKLHDLQVQMLLDVKDLNKLRSLRVQNCGNLVEIQGKLSQPLEELEIDSSESSQKLPDLLSL